MAQTRVLLVGEDSLAREGIAAMLAENDAIEVGGSMSLDRAVASEPQAIASFDVIVVDTQGEVESLSRLSSFGIPILALVADQRSIREYFSGHVRGMIFRQTTKERLISAIQGMAQQLVVLDEALVPALLRPSPPGAMPQETLTARESEVLQLLSNGLSNKEIAAQLKISEHTAKFHVNAIISKLGAESRTEAVVLAARLGLIAL